MILITDPEHAVPVQIERNGLRTIAVGAGDTTSLALPYLPANADVKMGDLLVTSGLGGVFPAGYPVARVTEVHHDAVNRLAQVPAHPAGRIDIDREVMLVWFRADHPAAPVAPRSLTPRPVTRRSSPNKRPRRPGIRCCRLGSSIRARSGSLFNPAHVHGASCRACDNAAANPRSAATSPGTAPPAPNTVKPKPTPSGVPSAAPDGTTSSAPTVSRPRKPATPPPAETTPSASGPAAAESATPPPASTRTAGAAMNDFEPRGRMLLTVLVALILTVLPLPPWLDSARPAFLVLTVLYWSIASPRAGGIALGWFSGFSLDVFQGPVLGEHALALALITYIAVREHQKIRSKPAFQQSLIVFAAARLLRIRRVRHRRLERPSRHQPAALGAHCHRCDDLAARRRLPQPTSVRRRRRHSDGSRPYASRITGASNGSSTSAPWSRASLIVLLTFGSDRAAVSCCR